MDFTNKTTVITGGANGIGKCIAQSFIAKGAKVAVIDIVEPDYICDLFVNGDVACEDTLTKFFLQVMDTFGAVDYLINNACISRGGILSGCGYDDFLYVQKVGVAAPYMLTKLFLPYFNSSAAIVNISSTRAFMSQPSTESYTAAKGGTSALTHALAISLAGKVRVNAIAPGWIDTTNRMFSEEDMRQHPSGRIGTPKDIANLAIFLCGDESGFINGQTITADGGMSKLMIYNDDCGWRYNPQ